MYSSWGVHRAQQYLRSLRTYQAATPTAATPTNSSNIRQ